ncbi:MAG: ABC transporter permease [Nitrospirae bacterium]|nr:ABC transporter permease [Nitrospirota bacterium]
MIDHLKKDKVAFAAALAILALILAALAAPLVAPYDPLRIDLDALRHPPSWSHWMGTDNKGRDVLSRVLFGARISLIVGVAATAVSMVIGLLVGIVSGYMGGKVDSVLSAFTDMVMAFPSLLLAIGITVVLPPGLFTVMLALAIVGWASFARLSRGMVLSIKEMPYVEAARASGCTTGRVLLRHVLPNCLPLIIIAGSLKVGGFILAESALSFLGLGAQPPTPTWGSMVSLSRNYILSAPWMVIFPGLAIAVTVLSFNILGDSLRDWLDPKMRV